MELSDLVADLRRAHAVHTVILYGSRARGDATPESDIDVAGFADIPDTVRDARMWKGLFLDAFVHPTELALTPDASLLKLLGGRVLLDERQLGPATLARVTDLDRGGPPALPDSELQVRRMWARKMVARARRGDLEAQYRRHWLLFQLLEDWFVLRGEWFRGPKQSFERLRLHAPDTLALFERALVPDAPFEAIERLVDHVVG